MSNLKAILKANPRVSPRVKKLRREKTVIEQDRMTAFINSLDPGNAEYLDALE